jgi:hypothetical protein
MKQCGFHPATRVDAARRADGGFQRFAGPPTAFEDIAGFRTERGQGLPIQEYCQATEAIL